MFLDFIVQIVHLCCISEHLKCILCTSKVSPSQRILLCLHSGSMEKTFSQGRPQYKSQAVPYSIAQIVLLQCNLKKSSAQMVITFDDQSLLSVSEDGCLIIWKLIDKEGRGLRRDREICYAEEILITKSDLEEKVSAGSSLIDQSDRVTHSPEEWTVLLFLFGVIRDTPIVC